MINADFATMLVFSRFMMLAEVMMIMMLMMRTRDREMMSQRLHDYRSRAPGIYSCEKLLCRVIEPQKRHSFDVLLTAACCSTCIPKP